MWRRHIPARATLAWLSLLDAAILSGNTEALNLLTVQVINSLFSRALVCHLHEAEATTPAVTRHDHRADNLAISFEFAFQCVLCQLAIQAANEQLGGLASLLPFVSGTLVELSAPTLGNFFVAADLLQHITTTAAGVGHRCARVWGGR